MRHRDAQCNVADIKSECAGSLGGVQDTEKLLGRVAGAARLAEERSERAAAIIQDDIVDVDAFVSVGPDD